MKEVNKTIHLQILKEKVSIIAVWCVQLIFNCKDFFFDFPDFIQFL